MNLIHIYIYILIFVWNVAALNPFSWDISTIITKIYNYVVHTLRTYESPFTDFLATINVLGGFNS